MTKIDALTRVHLDVERDLGVGELVNLIQNPSGDLGGWGWITPVASTAMSGGTELAYAGVASVANWFTSELSPVTAGNYVAASWTNPFHTNSGLARAQLVWYDSTGAVVSSGTQGAYQTSAGSYSISATVVPAGVTQVALRFDLYSTTGGVAPTSTTKSLWLSAVTMATAASAASLLQSRTNLTTNPSFETDTNSWSPSSSTLARTNAVASSGTFACQITATPDVATNLVTNPSFETNTTGWAAGSGTSTIARGSGGYSGSFSLICDTPTIASGASQTSLVNGPVCTGVTAGTTYYFTYAIYQDPSAASGTALTGNSGGIVRWFNSSGTQVGSDVPISQVGFDNRVWFVRSFSLVAPATATQVQIFPGLVWTNHLGSPSPTEFRIDRVGISTVNAYWDGSSTSTSTYQYAWTGTAHASTSTRTTVVTTAAAVTASIAASAGVTYAASAAFRAASTTRATSITFTWRNGAGATLSSNTFTLSSDSSSAWNRYGATATAPTGTASMLISFGANVGGFTAGEVHYIDAVLIEASTSVGTYFDGATPDAGGIDYSWTGTANASTSTAATTGNPLANLPPAYYVTITGVAASISIERQELNLSTLTSTIVSADLDPASSTLLQPDRRCRILVDTTGSGGWEPIFTGKTQKADVEYHLLENDPDRRAVISLTAVDALTRLAQESRPSGVGTIPQLPFVLEGCGVPWNVNGSGNQVATATVVASNDQASAVDQIAVTRDSNGGYAWVDRKGIVQVWDNASLSATVKDTIDETVYAANGFSISYATDRIINSVSVDSYEVNPATGETAVANYGPFRASGLKPNATIYDKTVTVQGLTSAQITTLATAILAANATPVRRIDSVTIPLTLETISRALLDLYDLVTVSNTLAGLSANMRIVGVTHTITATQRGTTWLMKLDFNTDDSIAAPQLIPAPSTGSGSALPATGLQIGKGVTVGGISAGTSSTITVTFPVAYATAANLKVDVMPFNSRLTPGLASLSATGFSVALSNWSTGNMAGTTFDWSAQTT